MDLLIESGYHVYPVEFKKTTYPSSHALKPFQYLHQLSKKVGPGAVICFVERDMPLSRTVTALPINYL